MTTQTTDKATARPWCVGTNGKSFCYFEPSYSTTVPIQIGYCEVLSRFNQDQKANAALIVKAVNEHAALVAVAEAAKAFLKPFIDMDDDAGSNMNLLEDALSNLAAIRAGKPVTGSEA